MALAPFFVFCLFGFDFWSIFCNALGVTPVPQIHFKGRCQGPKDMSTIKAELAKYKANALPTMLSLCPTTDVTKHKHHRTPITTLKSICFGFIFYLGGLGREGPHQGCSGLTSYLLSYHHSSPRKIESLKLSLTQFHIYFSIQALF